MPAVPEGMRQERKVVTALFADLVGSTALTETLDPEDAMEVVGGAVGQMVLVVEELGGTVKDLAGDGILALFGAPVAHEDDPERAIQAALHIIQTVAEHRRRLSTAVTLDVRVGIDTGLVVLGPVGAGSRVEYGATGDTVNIAARLQGAAEPGTVLVSDATQRLAVRSFVWGERRELQLKGKADPVRAWTVTDTVALPAPGQRHRRPLIGRGSDLAVIEAAMATALSGQSGLVVVLGDAGVGKSRLLDEARHLAWQQSGGLSWLNLHCASYESTVPFGPIRRLIQQWLQIGPGTPPQEIATRAAEAFAGILGGSDDDVHAGVDLVLGLPPRQPFPRSPESAAELAPFRVAEAVSRILLLLANQQPAVVVIEDLQWADQPTLALVDHLVARLDELPVLLVLMGRPVDVHPLRGWADMARSGLLDRAWFIELGPLAEDDAKTYLDQAIGAGTLPIDLEQAVLDRASGNPYYLEELLRALTDSGAVTAGAHGWQHDPSVPFVVPPTLERVVLNRIDLLPARARDVTEAAAVLGRAFDAATVAAVSEYDEADVAVVLKQLLALGLVDKQADRWQFAHPVVHEAVYDALLKRSRRQLHRRAAEVLTRTTPDDLAALSHHWLEAGEAPVAASLAEEAARAATQRRAFEEAAVLFDRAVDACAATGKGSSVRPELLLEQADARRRAGFLQSALAAYEAAHAAAAGTGSTEVMSAAALGYEDTLFATRAPRSAADPGIGLLDEALLATPNEVSGRRVQMLGAMARALAFGGRSTEARATADQAVQLARVAGEPAALAYALLAWRTERLDPPSLPERIPMAREALAAAEASGDPELWIESGRALFTDLLAASERQEADELHDELVARVLAENQPFHLWYPPMWHAQRTLLDGNLQEAEAAIEEFRRRARRLRYYAVDRVHDFLRFLLLREQGLAQEMRPTFLRWADVDPRAGLPLLVALEASADRSAAVAALGRLSADGFADLPNDQSRGPLLGLLAEGVAELGAAREAAAVQALLEPWRGQILVMGAGAGCIGSADHYLGLLAALTGAPANARALLEAARAQHERLRAPRLVRHTDDALARIVQDG